LPLSRNSDWPTPEPIDTLGDIARNADQAVHRALAFRGFVRLAGLSSDRSPMETVDLYREAMGFAVNPGQKKLVLARLAGLGSFEALQTAAGYLDDSELQSEAEVAVVGIAERTWPAHPELTRAFLGRLLETSGNETVRQRARAAVKRIDNAGDYIRSWQVSGPYAKQGFSPQELYGVLFAPEQDHGGNAEWQGAWAGGDIERPWAVDLLKALGGSDCAAYLRTNIWSPQTQNAQLLVGSNDGVKVWLNDSVAHENNVLRSLVRDEDKVDVTLKRGWNSLMLKVTQSGGQWGACARFRGSDGSKLENSRVCPYRTVVSGLELIGADLSAWRVDAGTWYVAGDAFMDPANEKLLKAEPGTGVIINGPKGRTVDLLSKAEFCDVAAHIEFMVPRGSNSGVYFMGRYEVQVLDSWGVKEPAFSDCGGIYQRWDESRNPKGYEGRSPRVNASLPPGQWQSFDVVFRGPRFDENGDKVTNARFVKVVHNGIVVHTNEEVTGPTRAARYKDEKPAGPLMLQGDHGPVAYRNIWVLPLEEQQ